MSELEQKRTQQGPWSTFFLAQEMFAVNAADVQEVMLQQPLTPVPLAPPHILGLLNLRGHIMPAVDLRRRLHFAPCEEGQETSLLVLKTQDGLLSVVVDRIGDVLELDSEHWTDPPDTLGAQHRRFVFGMCPLDKQLVLGLRIEALSSEEELAEGSKKK